MLDTDDRCPLVPGAAAAQGCPEPESDGDIVIDRLDTRPAQADLVIHDGCPTRQLVRIVDGKLEAIASVYFKLDRAIIEDRWSRSRATPTARATMPTTWICRSAARRRWSTTSCARASRKRSCTRAASARPSRSPTTEGRAHDRRVVFTIVGATTIQNTQQDADASTRE